MLYVPYMEILESYLLHTGLYLPMLERFYGPVNYCTHGMPALTSLIALSDE